MTPEIQKKMKICNYAKCKKKPIKGNAGVQSMIGWFCSPECSNAVAKRLAMVFMNIDPNTLEHYKPKESDLSPNTQTK